MPFSVEFNVAKNRMYIQISGLLSDEEVNALCVQAVAGSKKELKPGFTLVSDISTFRPVTQAGLQRIAAAVPEIAAVGMVASARVVDKASVAVLQYQRATKEAPYATYLVHSRAEGDEVLDKNHPARP